MDECMCARRDMLRCVEGRGVRGSYGLDLTTTRDECSWIFEAVNGHNRKGRSRKQTIKYIETWNLLDSSSSQLEPLEDPFVLY